MAWFSLPQRRAAPWLSFSLSALTDLMVVRRNRGLRAVVSSDGGGFGWVFFQLDGAAPPLLRICSALSPCLRIWFCPFSLGLIRFWFRPFSLLLRDGGRGSGA